jgi:hypothetical protein
MVVNAGKAAVVGSKCSPRRGSSPHVRKADRIVDAQPWSIVVRVSFAYADRGPFHGIRPRRKPRGLPEAPARTRSPAVRPILEQTRIEPAPYLWGKGGMIVGPWRISQMVLFKLFARTAERRESLF